MGVDVRTGTSVNDCRESGVETNSGTIEAATIIWAAGVKASPAAEWLDADRDHAGRIKVNADLSLVHYPNIFAIGDTAQVLWEDGKPVPGIAPAAKQMGRYVARVIDARIRKRQPPGPFAYRHLGDLATIGRKAAIVSLGKLQLTGFLGWLFWSVAHIYYLIGVRNRMVVALDWIWDYLTFQRGARLINEATPSREMSSREKSPFDTNQASPSNETSSFDTSEVKLSREASSLDTSEASPSRETSSVDASQRAKLRNVIE